jgi:hypothetical protein
MKTPFLVSARRRSRCPRTGAALRHCWRLLAAVGLLLAPAARAAKIGTRGDRFVLGGKLFDVWGVRVGSASQSEELKDALIRHLDEYLAHGVNTVTVFYQGTSGESSNPFSADGRAIDPAHQQRMEEIIRACDQRGMPIIVGIFYWGIHKTGAFADRDVLTATIATVTRALKPFRNVILNIANEQSMRDYGPHLTDPQRIIDYCRLVHEIDPKRVVGAGGFDRRNNIAIGKSPDVDVLLFDYNNITEPVAVHYDHYVAAGVTGKPIVDVELFGGYTKKILPPGVFPEDFKQEHYRNLTGKLSRPGLSVFFHNNPWIQGKSIGALNRFDLGGMGTTDDPGIRWYFEQVRRLVGRGPQ